MRTLHLQTFAYTHDNRIGRKFTPARPVLLPPRRGKNAFIQPPSKQAYYSMKNITVNQDEQGFWVALLDMPDRPFNVFSEDMMADLEQLIEQVLASCKQGQAP